MRLSSGSASWRRLAPRVDQASDRRQEDLGRVTSATLSFGLKRPLALGFVRRQQAEPGTPVAIRSGGERLAATVTVLPVPR